MKILTLLAKLKELAYAHDVEFKGLVAEHLDEFEVVFMVHADEYKSLLRVPSSNLEDQLLISIKSSNIDSSLESLSENENELTLEAFIAATLEYMVNEEDGEIDDYWYDWFNPIISARNTIVNSYNLQCFNGEELVSVEVDITTNDMLISTIWVNLPGGKIKRKVMDVKYIHYLISGDSISINFDSDKLSEDVTEWLLSNKNNL